MRAYRAYMSAHDNSFIIDGQYMDSVMGSLTENPDKPFPIFLRTANGDLINIYYITRISPSRDPRMENDVIGGDDL